MAKESSTATKIAKRQCSGAGDTAIRCWESPGSPAVSQQTQQESPGVFPAHPSHQRFQGCSSSFCHYSTIGPAVLLQLWTEHCSKGIKGSVRRAGTSCFHLSPGQTSHGQGCETRFYFHELRQTWCCFLAVGCFSLALASCLWTVKNSSPLSWTPVIERTSGILIVQEL